METCRADIYSNRRLALGAFEVISHLSFLGRFFSRRHFRCSFFSSFRCSEWQHAERLTDLCDRVWLDRVVTQVLGSLLQVGSG